MSNKNKLFAVILGYINIGIHNLSTLILTPTMISNWGGSSYGLYKVILSLLTYFMLIDSGIRSTIIRYVSEYRSKQDIKGERRYICVIASYYLVAAIVLSIVMFVFGLFVPQIYAESLTHAEIKVMQSALPLLLISTVSAVFFNSFSSLLKGHNKQSLVQLINVVRAVLRFFILYGMIRNGAGVTETIFAETTIAVVFAIIVLLYVFVVMKLPPLFKGIDFMFVKNIVSFTSVMLIYTVSTSLFWSVGTFLVGVMTSSFLASVYVTSITLTNMFQSLSSMISQVLVPDIMVKSFTSDSIDEMNAMMIGVGKIKLPVMLLIVLGFGLFGNEFVKLWVGEGYTGTYIIAFLTMVPLMLGLLQDVPNNYILAKNKHKILAVISLVGSAINILVSIILIKVMGIYGAALGTILSYAFVNIIFTFWYYKKTFSFDMKSLYVETIVKNIKYILILVLSGILIKQLPLDLTIINATISGWICFAVKVVLFVSVFAVVYLNGMVDEEIKKKILKTFGR